MEEINNQIIKLRELGLDDTKINALLALAMDEYIDQVGQELEDAEDEDLDGIAKEIGQINTQELTAEDATATMKNILKKVYGLSSESRLQNFMTNYLGECILQAEEAKNFILRVQANDPEALKQLAQAQQNPDYDMTKAALESVTQI